MENPKPDETRPTDIGGETIPTQLSVNKEQPVEQGETVAIPVPPTVPELASLAEEEGDRPASRRFLPLLILVSVLALLAIAAASAVGGYYSGIDRRTNQAGTQVAQEAEQQFALGVQDYEAKRYEAARQRFEYVIKLNPSYPGVTEKLALVLLELNTTATPTAVATPTLTPTPDLRGAEELFLQAQTFLVDGQWTEAIETLLKLRKDEPSYQTIKVDSLLYVALRNRGVQRILSESDPEGGTYDLALAERFGPLDVEASNVRTWADLYVTGASFWGLDWVQAIYYFGQLLQVAPNLRDGTNLTAVERFRLASIKYGDLLAGNEDWCQALEQYNAAFNYGSDPAVEPTVSWVANKCAGEGEGDGDKEEETPPAEGTPTPPSETPPPVTDTPAPPDITPTPPPTEPYPPPV